MSNPILAPLPTTNTSTTTAAPAAPPADILDDEADSGFDPADRARMDAQRAELMAQLGIDDSTVFDGVPDVLDGVSEQDIEPELPPSPNAVECDEFDLYKGRHLVTSEEYGLDKIDIDAEAVADCFAASYGFEPKLTAKCVDPYRSDFIGALMATPEFESLRQTTVGDAFAAEIAACSIAGKLNKYLVSVKPDPKVPPPATNGGARRRDLKAQVDCMVAAMGAAQGAQAAVGQHQEMQGMLAGNDGAKMDPKRAAELFKRIRKSKRLVRIAELAGRYRRTAASKQRMKVCAGTDDVVGVTVGGNAFKMIPSELANLSHPALKLETLSKLAENRALVWDQQGYEPAAKGPIVVVVDESGSMEAGTQNADGTVTARVEQAKALALSMAWIAAKQRRFCAFVSFSGRSQGKLTILPPGQWDEAKVIDWLEHFYGGGTDMDVPFVRLPNEYWNELMKAGAQRGKTDILLITDGEVNMTPEVEKSFMAWKQVEKAKLYTIVISSTAGDLKRVSDTIHLIEQNVLGANCDAVGQVLSI